MIKRIDYTIIQLPIFIHGLFYMRFIVVTGAFCLFFVFIFVLFCFVLFFVSFQCFILDAQSSKGHRRLGIQDKSRPFPVTA